MCITYILVNVLPCCNGRMIEKFIFVVKIRIHGSVHKPTLHFQHGNFVLILFLFSEHTWHHTHDSDVGHVWCVKLQEESFERLVGLVFLLDGIEFEFPLHTFQTNFELKLDNNFGGLFWKHRMLE